MNRTNNNKAVAELSVNKTFTCLSNIKNSS